MIIYLTEEHLNNGLHFNFILSNSDEIIIDNNSNESISTNPIFITNEFIEYFNEDRNDTNEHLFLIYPEIYQTKTNKIFASVHKNIPTRKEKICLI